MRPSIFLLYLTSLSIPVKAAPAASVSQGEVAHALANFADASSDGLPEVLLVKRKGGGGGAEANRAKSKPGGSKSSGSKSSGDKPKANKPNGDKPKTNRPNGGKPSGGNPGGGGSRGREGKPSGGYISPNDQSRLLGYGGSSNHHAPPPPTQDYDSNSLHRRKGGGGGGSSGGHGGGSSNRGGSGGKTNGGSSGGGKNTNTGGSSKGGSGPKPRYGGFYTGGAKVPYKAGTRTPSGINPIIVPLAAVAGFYGGVWIANVWSYPWRNTIPYTYYGSQDVPPPANETRPANGTNVPVVCLCEDFGECACDEVHDSDFVAGVMTDATADHGDRTMAWIANVNGTTPTLVINGSLPNDTAADSAAPGGRLGGADGRRGLMVVLVAGMVAVLGTVL